MTEVRADLSTAKVLLRACETRNEEDRGDYKVVTWTLHCPSPAPGHNNNMSQVSPHNTQHQAPHTYMSTLNLNESTYWYQKYPQTFFTPILNTKLGWKALLKKKLYSHSWLLVPPCYPGEALTFVLTETVPPCRVAGPLSPRLVLRGLSLPLRSPWGWWPQTENSQPSEVQ